MAETSYISFLYLVVGGGRGEGFANFSKSQLDKLSLYAI